MRTSQKTPLKNQNPSSQKTNHLKTEKALVQMPRLGQTTFLKTVSRYRQPTRLKGAIHRQAMLTQQEKKLRKSKLGNKQLPETREISKRRSMRRLRRRRSTGRHRRTTRLQAKMMCRKPVKPTMETRVDRTRKKLLMTRMDPANHRTKSMTRVRLAKGKMTTGNGRK